MNYSDFLNLLEAGPELLLQRRWEKTPTFPHTFFAADQNWIQHVLTHGGQQRLEPSLREDLEIPRQCTILDLVEEPPLVDAHNGGINHLHGRV